MNWRALLWPWGEIRRLNREMDHVLDEARAIRSEAYEAAFLYCEQRFSMAQQHSRRTEEALRAIVSATPMRPVFVDHIDGDPLNNTPENIRYVDKEGKPI